MALHKKDLRILQQLDLDSRQTTAKIAKKVGLSPETTAYRIKQLENKGIIQGYYSLHNVAAIGYTLYKVFMKLQNINKATHKRLINYLQKIEEVGLVSINAGAYDLEVGVIGKNLFVFSKILENLTKIFGKYIKSKDVLTITEMWQYNRKYLWEKPEIRTYYFYSELSNDIDNTDTKLLKHLGHNGRASNSEIERELGISRKVVAYRIKKLIQNNIILGFRPLIDRDKLKLHYFRVLIKLQALEEKKMKNLLEHLKVHPNVSYVIKAIGPWELEIAIEIEDSKKCHEFIMDLKYNFSDIISDTQILEKLEEYKYEFVLS